MKIKAVCEATGLSDRAIRYYIEEGLVSPAYTENYLGRKNYDFSDEDVFALERIAKLRRYDFSVEEIRRMLAGPDEIDVICEGLIKRKRDKLDEDKAIIAALEVVFALHPQSITELASALEKPSTHAPEKPSAPFPTADLRFTGWRRIHNIVSFIISILPIITALGIFVWCLALTRYPVVNIPSLIWTCLLLLPSVAALTIPRLIDRPTAHIVIKSIFALMCLLTIPIVFIASLFLVTESVTDRAENYMKLDKSITLSYASLFDDFFPSKDQFFADDSSDPLYHYHGHIDVFGHFTDICAQKEYPAEKNHAFEDEVDRVTQLFDSFYSSHAEYMPKGIGPGNKVITVKYEMTKHGRFNCIAIYDDYASPFEDYHEPRFVYLFAYDPGTQIVRYAYYNSTDYNEQLPFYTKMDW